MVRDGEIDAGIKDWDRIILKERDEVGESGKL